MPHDVLIPSDFDDARCEFLERWAEFVRDPAISARDKRHEMRATMDAVRQIAELVDIDA